MNVFGSEKHISQCTTLCKSKIQLVCLGAQVLDVLFWGEERWSVIFSLLMCVIFFLHKSISTKCFYPNNILVLVSINISQETIYNTVNDIKVSHEFRHVNSMSSGVQNLHLVFLWSVLYYQQMHQIVMGALSFKCNE